MGFNINDYFMAWNINPLLIMTYKTRGKEQIYVSQQENTKAYDNMSSDHLCQGICCSLSATHVHSIL